MCGIVGKVYLDGERPVDPELIQKMMDVIRHRGPDGEGKYVAGAVGMGHRRLSIIDLSTGAQPMCNEDGSVWIVFNGEIYNYPELRELLLKRNHAFRSSTDTEVIIHLFEDHGVDCLKHLRGMFAFALWDEKRRVLFLARDRVGIKPLYYSRTDRALSFGSEMKSLLVDPELQRELSPHEIDRFLTYRYLPGNLTLFKNVQKLEPGHYLLVKEGRVIKRQYWDLQFAVNEKLQSIDAAAEALSDLLRQTVKDHMVSDVPVGFLASGGVDSTALMSYAVQETNKVIQTFTIGFAGAGFADERPFARMAAERFGTAHHEISMSAADFQAFLPSYIWHMEEPVCEPPALALYYVSKLAREYVKVLISGEGGDEAFGGYPEYKNYLAFERGKAISGPLRGLAHTVLGLASRFDRLKRIRKYAFFNNLALRDYFYSRATSPYSYFNRNKRSLYSGGFLQKLDLARSADVTRQYFARVEGQHPLNQMLYVDTKSWLPDDLLIKADKITMATSLELRVPFLDHQVLEFAAALPPEFKVKGRATKRVLKRAFRDLVPKEILARKKTGFPVPYDTWLTGELRDFVSDILLSPKSFSREYFRRQALEQALRANTPEGAPPSEIFALLTLELWHRQFVDGHEIAPRTN